VGCLLRCMSPVLADFVAEIGTKRTCRLCCAMSGLEGKAENICSRRAFPVFDPRLCENAHDPKMRRIVFFCGFRPLSGSVRRRSDRIAAQMLPKLFFAQIAQDGDFPARIGPRDIS
jgi:hypothetical protein